MKKQDLAKAKELVDNLEKMLNGGKGSGNWGHAGRIGEVGGSAPAGTINPSVSESSKKDYKKMKREELLEELKKIGLSERVPDESKAVLVGRLERYETWKKNVEESQDELDRLGFTDEEKKILDTFHDGGTSDWVWRETPGTIREGTKIETGKVDIYTRGGYGEIDCMTVGAGKEFDNVESSLKPKDRSYIKSLEGLSFKPDIARANKTYKDGKWVDDEYKEMYQTWERGTDFWTAVKKETGFGKSKLMGKAELKTYSDHSSPYINISATSFKRHNMNDDLRDFFEYDISEIKDSPSGLITYGVNWNAIGRKDSRTARFFGNGLVEAADSAMNLEFIHRELEKKFRK